MMGKKRILYIDLLKLFTIYLVLWGHSIMHFQPDYQQSFIFRTIYSFHMPLFMMLSGYFAMSSMKLGAKDFFSKKFRQLLLPCISWAVICWLFISSGLLEGQFNLDLKKLFTGWLGMIDNFWFLKSCFICYTLAWLCWRMGAYKLPAMAVAWCLCAMQGHFHLNIMFPSFLLGMWLRNSYSMEKQLLKYWFYPAACFLLLLIGKLFFINSGQLLYNLALGLSGAVSLFALFHIILGKREPSPFVNRLALMGGGTLGIYILQAILLEILLPRYMDLTFLPMPAIIFLMPVISLATLVVCYEITRIISHSSILGFLLLGHKYQGN